MNTANGAKIAIIAVAVALTALGLYWFWANKPQQAVQKDFQNNTAERTDAAGAKGMLANELSQIDGIKIWPIDGQGRPMQGKNDWIWVVPAEQDDPTGQKDWDGNWTAYMMTKYGGLTKEQYRVMDLNKAYINVSGKRLADDCGVAVEDGSGKCPAVYQAEKITVSIF